MKEWYCWHFPELPKIVSDNVLFARVAAYVGNRNTLRVDDDKVAKLEEVVLDKELADKIVEAAAMSMGMDISDTDLATVESFAERIVSLVQFREKLAAYMRSKMESVAPNLSALIGETVAARLISHAGSLTNLAKCPASTVQILGAEKALFRALKTRGNTPKYGLIFHSSFIGRAAAKNKGRISRYLANKCAMASRIDSFGDSRSSVFGERMKEQVEERLSFYDTGKAPRKNLTVMQEASAENAKKLKASLADMDGEDEMEVVAPVTPAKKKDETKEERKARKKAEKELKKSAKKKRKREESTDDAAETPKKKKKRRKSLAA